MAMVATEEQAEAVGLDTLGGHVGPNAVTRLIQAMESSEDGRALLEPVFWSAEALAWLAVPPLVTVPEKKVAALYRALFRIGPPRVAHALACQAGELTADYVVEDRIPGFLRHLLPMLPVSFGATVLAKSAARHGWTFAGSGTVRARAGPGDVLATLEIENNPILMPDCAWQAAVMERMFSKVLRRPIRVRHEHSDDPYSASAASICRFELAPSNDD